MPIVQGPTGIENVAYLIQVDPTVVGYPAPVGSFAYSFSTGYLYVKIGEAPTEWRAIASTAQQMATTLTGGGATSRVFAVQVSASMDYVGGTTCVVWPAIAAGKLLSIVAMRVELTTRTGTCTTAPIVKMGTDVGHSNFGSNITVGASTAVINAITAPENTTVTLPSHFPTLDMASPLVAEITTPAAGTGGFAMTAQLITSALITVTPFA